MEVIEEHFTKQIFIIDEQLTKNVVIWDLAW
jgi:hypothetical protein